MESWLELVFENLIRDDEEEVSFESLKELSSLFRITSCFHIRKNLYEPSTVNEDRENEEVHQAVEYVEGIEPDQNEEIEAEQEQEEIEAEQEEEEAGQDEEIQAEQEQ